MGITTTRVEPKPVPREVDMIVVDADPHGEATTFGIKPPRSRNQFVIAQGSVQNTVGGVYRGKANMHRAHILFTIGNGLYLSPKSLRALAADMVELADQIERTA